MLNKIKSLGLSLMVGFMVVVSVPTTVNGLNNNIVKQEQVVKFKKANKKEIEKVTNIYNTIIETNNSDFGLITAHTTTNKVIEKYLNDKQLHDIAIKALNQYRPYHANNEDFNHAIAYDVELIMKIQDDYDYLENEYKKFNKKDNDERHVISFVFKYIMAKNLKIKYTADMCDECNGLYIPCKETAIVGDCGCKTNYEERGIELPKLSTSGVVAAYSNSNKINRVIIKVKPFVISEDMVIVTASRVNKNVYISYDRNTRRIYKQETCKNNDARDLEYKSLLK